MFFFSVFIPGTENFHLNFSVLDRFDTSCTIAIYFLSQMKEDIDAAIESLLLH